MLPRQVPHCSHCSLRRDEKRTTFRKKGTVKVRLRYSEHKEPNESIVYPEHKEEWRCFQPRDEKNLIWYFQCYSDCWSGAENEFQKL